MKLPPKDDPHGDREGALPRNVVLDVLRQHGVTATHLGGDLYELSKSDQLDVQSFPHLIGGILIKRLARMFEISTLEFYYDSETGARRFKPTH